MNKIIRNAYLVVGGVLFLLVLVGDNIEDEPLVRKPWIPEGPTPSEIRVQKYGLPKPQGKPRTSRPWDSDKSERTEEWADFLEEIENRGYDVWDPEAEDIWETIK